MSMLYSIVRDFQYRVAELRESPLPWRLPWSPSDVDDLERHAEGTVGQLAEDAASAVTELRLIQDSFSRGSISVEELDRLTRLLEEVATWADIRGL